MHPIKNFLGNRFNQTLTPATFLILLALSLGMLLPRLNWGYFVNFDYLWSEDGNIFIQQAHDMGIASIWHPYAGYLHIYPRSVSLLASVFPLLYQPIILTAGWFIAYLFMMAILIQRAHQMGARLLTLFFLVVLVALQPNNGEVFFNITNTQWLLGATLSILSLTYLPSFKQPSRAEIILLFLLGLTGPFSIILAPILLIKALLFMDLKRNQWKYLPIFLSALTQGVFIVSSNRLHSAYAQEWMLAIGMHSVPIHTQIESVLLYQGWIVTFFSTTIFHSVDNRISLWCAICFWLIVFKYIFKKQTLSLTQKESRSALILLLLSACLFIAAGIFSLRETPFYLLDFGTGNRYTWIPYTLLLFSALSLTQQFRFKHCLLFSFALILFCTNFYDDSKKALPERQKLSLQFKSFANFAQHHDVTIPINPFSSSFPGPSISLGLPETTAQITNLKQALTAQTVTSDGNELTDLEQGVMLQSNHSAAILDFKNKIDCGNASDIGIEFEVQRSTNGWVYFYWDAKQKFSERKYLKRWYPSGLFHAQFAFPNEPGGVYLRLIPNVDSTGSTKITKFGAYCLP